MKLENFFNYYKPNIYYRAIFFTKKKKNQKFHDLTIQNEIWIINKKNIIKLSSSQLREK